ncbi:hypothetical protein Zm00014a_023620 [Zea mays]|uniref:Uncharacterized protein n=1 Tax=Zea mays TaxID=4577 RepID=A0A3L6FVX1_MAIZE|nr:hypothetical protein Zm00014a_023620 [Zea mays]
MHFVIASQACSSTLRLTSLIITLCTKMTTRR